ncbi:MAG TPA: transposase, partial [Acidobacteriota bacterium]|nr:transposase [Acidobacteriota bacterium]
MAGKRKQKQRTRDTITRAVTHIRLVSLEAANESKRQQLDELGGEYQRVCQAYVTLFCTMQNPDPECSFEVETRLSARWHRDAIR